MQFKKIEIEDKEVFDAYLSKYQPEQSEFTFTNLFVWRHIRGHEWTEIDGHLILSLLNNEKRSYYQPIGPHPASVIRSMIEEDTDVTFERVSKKVADSCKKDFLVEEQRDMFDYVYSIVELKELKGGKFEQKRNFVRRLEKLGPKVCILDESTIEAYYLVQKEWCDFADCENNPSLLAESIAVKEALDNFKVLGLMGVCVQVKDKTRAFAIGEKLNNDTFVEHFEKGSNYFKGIYQYLLHKFARNIPDGHEFLNREQDLGIPGLRKAKESWGPVKMVEKFRISAKKQSNSL